MANCPYVAGYLCRHPLRESEACGIAPAHRSTCVLRALPACVDRPRGLGDWVADAISWLTRGMLRTHGTRCGCAARQAALNRWWWRVRGKR